jgi:hypothetical protein
MCFVLVFFYEVSRKKHKRVFVVNIYISIYLGFVLVRMLFVSSDHTPMTNFDFTSSILLRYNSVYVTPVTKNHDHNSLRPLRFGYCRCFLFFNCWNGLLLLRGMGRDCFLSLQREEKRNIWKSYMAYDQIMFYY